MKPKHTRIILFALAVGAFLLAAGFGSELPEKWEDLTGSSSPRRAFKVQVFYTLMSLIGGIVLFRTAWHIQSDPDLDT